MPKTKNMELIDQAFELVEKDHGGCDDNSCDIGLALAHDYDAIAIVQWSFSGAICEKFNTLYDKIPMSYKTKEYDRQVEEFLKEMKSVQCPHCNSMCRNINETPDYCDCCAKQIK